MVVTGGGGVGVAAEEAVLAGRFLTDGLWFTVTTEETLLTGFFPNGFGGGFTTRSEERHCDRL